MTSAKSDVKQRKKISPFLPDAYNIHRMFGRSLRCSCCCFVRHPGGYQATAAGPNVERNLSRSSCPSFDYDTLPPCSALTPTLLRSSRSSSQFPRLIRSIRHTANSAFRKVPAPGKAASFGIIMASYHMLLLDSLPNNPHRSLLLAAELTMLQG